MEWEKFTPYWGKFKGIFTPARLKKAGIMVVLGAICAGGGAFYHHQQKAAQHARILEARTLAIQAQAEKNNLALLDQNAIRTLAAESIGIDETEITYREISLQEHKWHKDRDRDHDKHKHSHKREKDEALAAPAQDTVGFHPVYRLSCLANDVKYKMQIDAVSGKVIDMKIDSEKDWMKML